MKKGDTFQNVSWMLLRIAVGAIFILHGYPKIFSSPELLGLPGFVGLLVGLVEVVFGALVLVGFGFPWVTYPVLAVITVAFFFMQVPGAVDAGRITGTLERDGLILLLVLALGAFGPGKYAFKKFK